MFLPGYSLQFATEYGWDGCGKSAQELPQNSTGKISELDRCSNFMVP